MRQAGTAGRGSASSVAKRDFKPGVVGGDDERRAVPPRRVLQQQRDRGGGLVVEIGRGLIGEQHLRTVHERSRDGHALLLADGELVGHRVRAFADAEGDQHRSRGGAVDRAPGDVLRDQQVLQRGERRQQVELLQDDADVPAAKEVARRRRELREILPGDDDAPGGRAEEPRDQMQQRRLPASGRTDDQHVVAFGQPELGEPHDFGAAGIVEAEVFEADHRASRPTEVGPSGPSS